MNNTVTKAAAFFALITGISLMSGRANAQIQVNLTGNHFSSAESGSTFSDGFWGGGATLRYFASPKFAIGLNGRYFTRSESVNFVGGSAKTQVNLLMVTGQAEYFFTESALRPYAGIEAGLYHSSATIDLGGLGSGSDKADNFGFAPKLGLQYAISPAFGLNADAGYHLIFADGETSKTLLLGAGIFFTFGQK